ncbi:MAG: hypothetical protein ACI9MC_002188, partial [Kiritimatiellia bacterium]
MTDTFTCSGGGALWPVQQIGRDSLDYWNQGTYPVSSHNMSVSRSQTAPTVESCRRSSGQGGKWIVGLMETLSMCGYLSPMMPHSRAVWMICIEMGRPKRAAQRHSVVSTSGESMLGSHGGWPVPL